MKKLNEFIGKIGSDKVMHFLVGMVVVANFAIFGWTMAIVGLFVNLVVQFIKEKYIDDTQDYGDTAAGFMGGIVELIISGLILIL